MQAADIKTKVRIILELDREVSSICVVETQKPERNPHTAAEAAKIRIPNAAVRRTLTLGRDPG
jgi:hypothetical protein